jgi:hypothetical protein
MRASWVAVAGWAIVVLAGVGLVLFAGLLAVRHF